MHESAQKPPSKIYPVSRALCESLYCEFMCMSMTLIAVVSLSCGLNTGELEANAERLALPITFPDHTDLREHSGFLPVFLAGMEAGVETYFDEAGVELATLPEAETLRSEGAAILEFRWGATLEEAASAFYIAHILAESCDATIFDPQEQEYVSASLAKDYAEELLRSE